MTKVISAEDMAIRVMDAYFNRDTVCFSIFTTGGKTAHYLLDSSNILVAIRAINAEALCYISIYRGGYVYRYNWCCSEYLRGVHYFCKREKYKEDCEN